MFSNFLHLTIDFIRSIGKLIGFFDLIGPPQNLTYSARFGKRSALLSRKNKGFTLSGTRALPFQLSSQHLLVAGGSGSGKSTSVVIPNLLRLKGSAIVHDPSGELWTKTSGYLSSRGFKVQYLDFAEKSGDSSGYNPLHRAKSRQDIQKLASMLVRSTLGEKSSDPFREISAKNLLTLSGSLLSTQPQRLQTPANLRQVVLQLGIDAKPLEKMAAKSGRYDLIGELKSLLAYDKKVFQGIIATAKAALHLFADPVIARISSVDTLNLDRFRKEASVLFLRNHTTDARYYRPILSLVLEQALGQMMQSIPEQSELPVYFIIDEASTLYIPSLPVAIVNLRKYRCPVMLVLQSLPQLKAHYSSSEAETLSKCLLASILL